MTAERGFAVPKGIPDDEWQKRLDYMWEARTEQSRGTGHAHKRLHGVGRPVPGISDF
jgi:hypothetical protein